MHFNVRDCRPSCIQRRIAQGTLEDCAEKRVQPLQWDATDHSSFHWKIAATC